MTMILIGLGAGGCSLSRSDGGAFAKMDENNEVTGAITPPAGPPVPTESDLAFARTAASDVLTKGDKDSSQPWENPETGARGSVTPLSQPMPLMMAVPAGISWPATSRAVPKAGCRALPAGAAKAGGKFIRSGPGNGARAFPVPIESEQDSRFLI
jgi:hypothetical protein